MKVKSDGHWANEGLMSFHIVVRMHGTKTSSTKATVRIVTVTESNKRIICRVAARSCEFIKQKMNKEPKTRTYICFTGLFIDRLFYLFIIVFFVCNHVKSGFSCRGRVVTPEYDFWSINPLWADLWVSYYLISITDDVKEEKDGIRIRISYK